MINKATEFIQIPVLNKECICGNYKEAHKIKKVKSGALSFLISIGCDSCKRFTEFMPHRGAIEAYNRGDVTIEQ